MKRRSKTLVVCVDGGVPEIAAHWNMFAPRRLGLKHEFYAGGRMQTIFPSSTAPAHASMVSGRYPSDHGVIGNRYWLGNEEVPDIRQVAADPVTTLHPYRVSGRYTDSVADSLEQSGATIAAVNFPSLFDSTTNYPSVYTVYSPSYAVTVKLNSVDHHSPQVRLFGGRYSFRAYRVGNGFDIEFVTDADPAEILWKGRCGFGVPTEMCVVLPGGGYSTHLVVGDATPTTMTISSGTGTLVLASHSFPADADVAKGSSSSAASYLGGVDNSFHETPNDQWVLGTAMKMVDLVDPDVLFVRFNQADHAQEHLYWQAVRGVGASAIEARAKIFSVYEMISERVRQLVAYIGDDQLSVIVVSDHGIDYVERHVNPNVVVDDLGLTDRAVFQGDSNIAYLYGPDLSAPEVDMICAALAKVDGVVRLTDMEKKELGLPNRSARLGRAAVLLGEHQEFMYGQPDVEKLVRSASHGYRNDARKMDGVACITAPVVLALPGHITEVRHTIERAWACTAAGLS